MQVSVEKINSVECSLTITVPAELVTAAFTKHIQILGSKANIKGFRPGKAPKELIQQQYGAKAREEAYGEVIESSLYAALAQNKIVPVSTPKVEPESILAGQPLKFKASFEVLPEISEIKFAIDKIEKLNVAVTDADIERVINQLQKQYAKWKVVDREAKAHDRVVIDYYAIFEGKSDTDNKIQNHPLELGTNTMMPGFEEGLFGIKAGEERTLHLTFPETDANKENAGKPIEFVVTAKQVYEADMPAIDHDLIKKLGVASGELTDLQKQIKQSLEQERDRLTKENLKEQVFSKLLEQNPIDVPSILISREAKKIHDQVHPHAHDHHNHSQDEMMMFTEVAKKRVMLGLLVGEYTKKVKIQPDEARINARINDLASAYENPKEVIEWLSTDERRHNIAAQVAEDMVLEKFIEGVPVVEKVMTYAELKGIHI